MNADTTGGERVVLGGVLGGTAGDGWGRAAAYDAYADGLHTYALWYLRDHDAAADAVYCAFAAADRNHTTLQQPEQIQPWLYALLRRECRLRAGESESPAPVSARLRPKSDGLGDSGVGASLLQLEGNLRRAEFHSLAWPDADGLAPAHREVLELTIRHGLDSRGLALVLGLREGAAGLAPTRGFGLLADAWRELERSLAATAVAGSGRENCAQLAELTFGWSGKLNPTLRAPLIEHVDRCSRCQHYLHTVIGTPSAPTILPFVAVPRALRDLLLGELADAAAAQRAGVDLVGLGRRSGPFGPEGFPAGARGDHAQGSATAFAGTGAGTGTASVRPPRRRQTPARPHRSSRLSASAGPGAGAPVGNAGGYAAGDADPQAVGGGSEAVATHRLGSGARAAMPLVQPLVQPDSVEDELGATHRSSGDAREDAVSQGPDGLAATAAYRAANAAQSAGSQSRDDGAAAAGTHAFGDAVLPARGPRSQNPDGVPAPARLSVRASCAPENAGNADAATDSRANDPRTAHRTTPRTMRRVPEVEDLFSANGSWAERVLPPVRGAVDSTAGNTADRAGSDRRASGLDEPTLWRPAQPAEFVETPSGRFALRTPGILTAASGATSGAAALSSSASRTAPVPRVSRSQRSTSPTALTSAEAASSAPHTPSRLPRYARTPGGSAPVRPRHKARPMRQAVVSAVALGAIGAVAAAAAALLGASGDPHTDTALDHTGPNDVAGVTPGSHRNSGRDGLSVTVGTASGGSSAPASVLGLPGARPGSGANTPSGSASSTASAGGFYVSINQRDGDPDSVRILLRNAGNSALNWSAAPDVAWLTLSQTSGTLAPGQSLAVTATAGSAAPSGEWTAHIVFQPDAIVVTVHGGIPAGSSGTPGAPATSPTGSGASSGAPGSSSPTTGTGTGSAPSSPPSSMPGPGHSAPASSASAGGTVAPSGTSAAPASTSPTSPQPSGPTSPTPTRSTTSGSSPSGSA